jgi:hypothetical protein
MIKRIAKVILATMALLVLAIIVFVLICVFERPGYTKTEIAYGGVDFQITSWGDWPHDTRYNFYYYDGGKKKLILKDSANGHPSSFDFSLEWTTNGVYYAYLSGDCFCVDGNEVTLFDWKTSEKSQFVEYFRWILDTQEFGDRYSVAPNMCFLWGDPEARRHIQKYVNEDPQSDFFPDSIRDSVIEMYKDHYSKTLKKYPNQLIDPTVKTPVESGKVQGTAGHE